MIKKIKIFNRFNMDNFLRGQKFPFKGERWHLISIYGDGDSELLTDYNTKLFEVMGCVESLSLNFWDITPPCSQGILFHKGHAKQVVDFLDRVQKEQEDSILVTHCHAGISRSGAVGTFTCDYCGLDYDDFIEENRYICANDYVLKLLHEQSGKPDSFEWHDGIDPYDVDEGIIILPSYDKKGGQDE